MGQIKTKSPSLFNSKTLEITPFESLLLDKFGRDVTANRITRIDGKIHLNLGYLQYTDNYLLN